MTKIVKLFSILSLIFAVAACSSTEKEEQAKTARHRSALERINAGQNGGDVITKDLDQ